MNPHHNFILNPFVRSPFAIICLLFLYLFAATPKTPAQCSVAAQNADPANSSPPSTNCQPTTISPETRSILTGPIPVTVTVSGGYLSCTGVYFTNANLNPTITITFSPPVAAAGVDPYNYAGFDVSILTGTASSSTGSSETQIRDINNQQPFYFRGGNISQLTITASPAGSRTDWFFGIPGGIGFVPQANPTPVVGSLSADTLSAPIGGQVNVSGAGWVNPSGSEYHLLLTDGNTKLVVANQLGLACSTQPQMSFQVPCLKAGNYKLIDQLVNTSTQQVILSSLPIDFTIARSALAPLASSCQTTAITSITDFNAVPRNGTIRLIVSFEPETLDVPITLSINTKKGTTGSAIFSSTNTAQMVLDKGTTSPTLIIIKGVTESSTADNMELAATSPNSNKPLASVPFTVLFVKISMNPTNRMSKQDGAVKEWERQINIGSDELGTVYTIGLQYKFWRNIAELRGEVLPSNYQGKIIFRRYSIEKRAYNDTVEIPELRRLNDPDNTPIDFIDTDPKPDGMIYDLDGPGADISQAADATILRVRENFRQYAVIIDVSGNELKVSDDYFWFNRLSVYRTNVSPRGVELLKDISGDNVAFPGSTKVTWDLQ